MYKGTITVTSHWKKINLKLEDILYVKMQRNDCDIHLANGEILTIRTTFKEFERELGDGFLQVKRGTLISVMAIQDITDKVNLSNGERVEYTKRAKGKLQYMLHEKQKDMITELAKDSVPMTEADYREYYKSFDHVPFAFTDIEMVFNDDRHAVDWIFCYGNEPLAALEKVPLEKLIGNSFGRIFENMDAKWLHAYERAVLYGEKLEITDYSPEIDTHIKVICFPTFPCHCGCILFDTEQLVTFHPETTLLRPETT